MNGTFRTGFLSASLLLLALLPIAALAQSGDGAPAEAAAVASPEAAASPTPAATPAADSAADDAPLLAGPDRVTYLDGLRDGGLDAADAGLFAKVPAPAPPAPEEYVRGYRQAYGEHVRRHRRNVFVVGGFVILAAGLGAFAIAQSKSGKSGTIDPPPPALFRF